MPSPCPTNLLALAALLLAAARPLRAQEAPSMLPTPAPIERLPAPPKPVAPPQVSDQPAQPDTPEQPSPDVPTRPTPAHFDPTLFAQPLPANQLSFLKSFDGASSGELWRDKQLHQLLKAILPSCEFHYGRDMPLKDALDMAISGSRDPVQLRDGRYLTLSGSRGPYLAGRAMLWIDLDQGLALGAFFFTPTNGEPTPTLAVFSRQVSADFLNLGQLPPAFAFDLAAWSARARVPPVETRYFLTANKERVLLQHDEDFCSPANGSVGALAGECEAMNADAADLDEAAADYLDQVHHATNATAWMLDPQQVSFIAIRERTCGSAIDPFACRIRLSTRRTAILIRRPPHR